MDSFQQSSHDSYNKSSFITVLQARGSMDNLWITFLISIYRIYPAIRRGFCPSRMTPNN